MGSIDKGDKKGHTGDSQQVCAHTEQSSRHARNQSRGATGCHSDKAKGHRTPPNPLLGGTTLQQLHSSPGRTRRPPGWDLAAGLAGTCRLGGIQQAHKDRDRDTGSSSGGEGLGLGELNAPCLGAPLGPPNTPWAACCTPPLQPPPSFASVYPALAQPWPSKLASSTPTLPHALATRCTPPPPPAPYLAWAAGPRPAR